MQATDLAVVYPTVTYETPVLDAARMLARGDLPGLIVVDSAGAPQVVLPGTQVLRFAIPHYFQDDPTLTHVVEEPTADLFARELSGRTVRDCLPDRPAEPPVVTGDATDLEIASLMAQTHTPLVAVVDDAGCLIGVVTLHRLCDAILGESA